MKIAKLLDALEIFPNRQVVGTYQVTSVDDLTSTVQFHNGLYYKDLPNTYFREKKYGNDGKWRSSRV